MFTIMREISNGLINAVIIALLLINCKANSGEQVERATNKELNVELDKLRRAIEAMDWQALGLAEEIGSPAIPMLEGYLKNDNAEVRNIALNCIEMTNDVRAIKIISGCLMDESESVRVSAMQILNSYYDDSIKPELILNIKNTDPDVRGFAAILLAKLDDKGSMSDLNEQLEKEPDSTASREISLALARLGDEKFQDKFASQLDIEDSKTRYQGIRDLKFINDRKLAARLIPAFSDQGEVYIIGDKDDPRYGRVCDAVINLVAKWYEGSLTFDTGAFKIYSDDEIEEARRFVESQGENHE